MTDATILLPRMAAQSDGSGPVLVDADSGRLLATVAPGPWSDNGWALARAMASSPEAIEALQDLVGVIERRLGPAADSLVPVRAAREIIAKAEGRS